ncbi:MAG: dTDP-glucose 4,6-dehydratase, partial [Bacteroidota bacterium]
YPHYHVIGLDNCGPYSRRSSLTDLESQAKIHVVVADICDSKAIDRVYHDFGIDTVVNFAAESHNDRAIIDPTSFVQSNVFGAQCLLEVSRQRGVRRHVHVSTIEVYGEQDAFTQFFTESSPLNAKTPYSAAKAAGDLMVRAYMQTYRKMDICMTHCANNYGPFQFPEKLIPLCITNVLRGKKVPLYGDGKQSRDWLHVDDHCHAIELILNHEGKFLIGEDASTNACSLPIFDISARQEMTNIQIVECILDEMGVSFNENVEFVQDRPNHDRRYLINPTKIEQLLGFKPKVAFEQGLRAVVRWYQLNKEWWEPIINEAPPAINWNTVKVPGL